MSEMVAVFGFGSYFKRSTKPRDIDLLLVHDSTQRDSCLAGIACKRALLRELPGVDVIILAKSEVDSLQFIQRAGAIWLGNVDPGLKHEIDGLVSRIASDAPICE